jgi:type III pantothenate kinase
MLRRPEYPMLVIDAGNTSVKFAIVMRPGGTPKPVLSVPTAKLAAAAVKRIGAKARSVGISSVVPAASRILQKAFPQARFIGPKTALGFKSLSDRKMTGSDRLANVAAAQARCKKNVLVVSFGTATTFDVIDAGGVHRGGAIAPGWRAFASLPSSKTALLPRVPAKAAKSFIGKNTREALAVGTAGGYAAVVLQIIDGMKREAGVKKLRVITTGGDATSVAKIVKIKSVSDPLLTLRGIALLCAADAREVRK